MVTISLLEVTAADAAQNLLVLSSVHSLLGGHGFYAFAYLTYLVSPDAARPRGMLLTARPASGQDDRMDPLQKLAAIGHSYWLSLLCWLFHPGTHAERTPSSPSPASRMAAPLAET